MQIFTKFAQDNIVAYAVAALGFGGRVAATAATGNKYIYDLKLGHHKYQTL